MVIILDNSGQTIKREFSDSVTWLKNKVQILFRKPKSGFLGPRSQYYRSMNNFSGSKCVKNTEKNYVQFSSVDLKPHFKSAPLISSPLLSMNIICQTHRLT